MGVREKEGVQRKGNKGEGRNKRGITMMKEGRKRGRDKKRGNEGGRGRKERKKCKDKQNKDEKRRDDEEQ